VEVWKKITRPCAGTWQSATLRKVREANLFRTRGV
jgi:hypothetical protein